MRGRSQCCGGWWNSLLAWLNPGEKEEEVMESLSRAVTRRCQNIKSRKNPDIQCSQAATQGDYCFRHYRNPRPFQLETGLSAAGLGAAAATQKIQKAWRRWAPLHRFCSQGPAANWLSLAVNDTELYSLAPTAVIPPLYLFTFGDSHKVIWAFDIRTLAHSMGNGFAQQNPYTREPLPPLALRSLHRRLEWLRARKYQVQHLQTDVLSPEQLWNQRVLDVFLKIEALGYYASNTWFHSLSTPQHEKFYKALFSLWEWRLGLSTAEKEKIIPRSCAPGTSTSTQLFRYTLTHLPEKDKHWWERCTIGLMETFVTRSPQQEYQKLGALYILMALVEVSHAAAFALPWVVETVPQ